MDVRICGVVPSAPPNGDTFLIIIILLQAVSIHELIMSHSFCFRQVGHRAASRCGSRQGPLWAALAGPSNAATAKNSAPHVVSLGSNLPLAAKCIKVCYGPSVKAAQLFRFQWLQR